MRLQRRLVCAVARLAPGRVADARGTRERCAPVPRGRPRQWPPAAAPCDRIHDRISSARQAVTPSESLTGAGKVPARTRRQSVEGEKGIKSSKRASRTNPVCGRVGLGSSSDGRRCFTSGWALSMCMLGPRHLADGHDPSVAIAPGHGRAMTREAAHRLADGFPRRWQQGEQGGFGQRSALQPRGARVKRRAHDAPAHPRQKKAGDDRNASCGMARMPVRTQPT